MKAIKGQVIGKVQGVFFRVKTREQAQRLDLTGWVRNTPEGTVEFFMVGDEVAISQIQRWLKTGPGLARVDRLDVESCPPERFESFSIRY